MSPAVSPSPIPFPDFVARLLACYAEPLRAPATLSKMKQVMADLSKAPGLSTTADLTTATVAWWVAERSRTVCANTIDGELGYVSAACAHAVEEGWLSRNPCASKRLRVRPEPPARGQHHAAADVARVLAHLRERSGFTWRSLRHSWATHAESRWGLGEAAIQRVLRHTRPLTQRRYRHADAANLRAIGELVCYADC